MREEEQLMYISVSDRNGGKKDEQVDGGGRARRRNRVQTLAHHRLAWRCQYVHRHLLRVRCRHPAPVHHGFLGLSVVAFGVLDGINQGASALVRIAAGWASDRMGHPKRVALAGYGLSMAARIGFLFAGGFWSLTAIITGDRIGKGIRTAPRDALITVSAQPEHLARHFGVHRMLDNIGAAGGPLAGFFILMVMPNGYLTVFVVSLAFAVIGVAALALLVPDLRAGRVRR